MTDPSPHILKFGDCAFAPVNRLLCVGSHSFTLTHIECELLTLLCKYANQLLPRRIALANIWYSNTRYNARSMDVYIYRLRKYLRHDTSTAIINVRGKGFTMIAPEIKSNRFDFASQQY